MSTPGRECCSGRRLRTAGAGGGASPAGHGMERRRGAGVFRELGAYTAPAMPAVAAMRGAQHLVPVATSASSSVAAARCKRARLPDAHEEVVGNPERGGAPSSRGGRRSQSVDGVCDTDWVDGISNTVRPLATYRPSDATWAAEIVCVNWRLPRQERSAACRWAVAAGFGGLGEAASCPLRRRRRPAGWCERGHTCS